MPSQRGHKLFPGENLVDQLIIEEIPWCEFYCEEPNDSNLKVVVVAPK